MNSYRVEIEFQTPRGRADESFTITVDAVGEDDAIAQATALARSQKSGCRGKVTHAGAELVPVEDLPVVEAEPEAVALTAEQVAEVETMAAGLREGCAVRLALEIVLVNDRLVKLPELVPHDFGAHGSARYCKRCETRNQPPVNRWGCKGGAA